MFHDVVLVSARHRVIGPKGIAQKKYIEAIREHDVVFGIGPAGTGKTYLAVAMAVSALTARQIKRIILTRPAVEAGEKLGFLPGDLAEKVNPYLRPLYDALHDMMDLDKATALIQRGQIEVAPLAFMRGRTLNDSFVILDEAQTTTPEQMKMFLTRLGFDSKAVITGDVTQVDLPEGRKSGLSDAIHLLSGVEGIRFCTFTDVDVVRHPLVAKIVRAYDARDSAVERGRALREEQEERATRGSDRLRLSVGAVLSALARYTRAHRMSSELADLVEVPAVRSMAARVREAISLLANGESLLIDAPADATEYVLVIDEGRRLAIVDGVLLSRGGREVDDLVMEAVRGKIWRSSAGGQSRPTTCAAASLARGLRRSRRRRFVGATDPRHPQRARDAGAEEPLRGSRPMASAVSLRGLDVDRDHPCSFARTRHAEAARDDSREVPVHGRRRRREHLRRRGDRSRHREAVVAVQAVAERERELSDR